MPKIRKLGGASSEQGDAEKPVIDADDTDSTTDASGNAASDSASSTAASGMENTGVVSGAENVSDASNTSASGTVGSDTSENTGAPSAAEKSDMIVPETSAASTEIETTGAATDITDGTAAGSDANVSGGTSTGASGAGITTGGAGAGSTALGESAVETGAVETTPAATLESVPETTVEETTVPESTEAAKKVKLSFHVVDEDGEDIDEKYVDVKVSFDQDGVLTLDDSEKAPVRNIRKLPGPRLFGLLRTYSKNYTYKEATLGGDIIRAIRKTTDEDEHTVYEYTMDGENWTAFEEDSEILLVYCAPETKGSGHAEYIEEGKIKVVVDLKKDLPEGVELRVQEVTDEDQNYDAYMTALDDAAKASASEIEKHSNENTLLYDIAFIGHDEDGQEYEYQPGEDVSVKVSFLGGQLAGELGASDADNVVIKHLPVKDEVKENAAKDGQRTTADMTDLRADDIKVEDVKKAKVTLDTEAKIATVDAEEDEDEEKEVAESKDEVTFTTDGFSTYAIICTKPEAVKAVKVNLNLPAILNKYEAFGYGVIASDYSWTGDTETNVMVDQYRSTAAQIGSSPNYGNAGGVDYIGKLMPGTASPLNFHYAPKKILFGNDAYDDYNANTSIVTFNKGTGPIIVENKNYDVASIVKKIGSDVGTIVDSVSTEATTLNRELNEIYNIDLTDKTPGVYLINFDANDFSTNTGSRKLLSLKTDKNHKLIVNCTGTGDIFFHDYEINGRGTADWVADTNPANDWIPQAVTFYFPNAKSINLKEKSLTGEFIVPNGTMNVTQSSAGIIVAQNARGLNGEWHYHNHELPATNTISVKKIWDDNYNEANKRPGEIIVQLYKNGKPEGAPMALNESNDWAYSWTVPTSSDTYTVDEVPVPKGYKKTITGDESVGFVITNTLETPEEETSVELEATKILEGQTLQAGQFSFELKGADGSVLQTKQNTADGKIRFDKITYNEEDAGKTFNYTIEEVRKTDHNYKYDTHVANVTVQVEKDASGKLTATANYEDSKLIFTNTYINTAKGSIVLGAKKVLEGKDLIAGQFSFQLKDSSGKVLQTATNDKDGNIVFKEITYTLSDVGTKTYKIEEVNGKAAGYTYDDHVVDVEVSVTDNNDGTLATSATYDGKTSCTFKNSYVAAGSVVLNVRKELSGRKLAGNQFTFELVGADDRVLQTKKNAADGSVTFDAIDYTQEDSGKSYSYQIREVNEGAPGYTYDDHIVDVKVSVTDNNDGTLATSATYDGEAGYTFTNTYTANGSAVLTAKKVLEGKNLAEGQFSFELKDKAGKVLETVTNAADGTISFAPINYSLADVGTKIYTIHEVEGGEKGYTYDKHVETVTVKISDKGDGTLDTAVDYDADGAVFTNYSIDFKVNKFERTGTRELDGAKIQIKDSTGAVIAEWISKSGEMHDFGSSLKAGETYTIHEETAPSGYYTISDMNFTVDAKGQITLAGSSEDVKLEDGVIKICDERIKSSGGGGGGDHPHPTPETTPAETTPAETTVPETTPVETTAPETNPGGGNGGHHGPSEEVETDEFGNVLGANRGRNKKGQDGGNVKGASRGKTRTGDESMMSIFGFGFLAAVLVLLGWFGIRFTKRNRR